MIEQKFYRIALFPGRRPDRYRKQQRRADQHDKPPWRCEAIFVSDHHGIIPNTTRCRAYHRAAPDAKTVRQHT